MEMCVFGAFRRQKRAFPKIRSLKMCLLITRSCPNKKLNFQAVIKLAASAASLDFQGSPASPAVCIPSQSLLPPQQVTSCWDGFADFQVGSLWKGVPKVFFVTKMLNSDLKIGGNCFFACFPDVSAN